MTALIDEYRTDHFGLLQYVRQLAGIGESADATNAEMRRRAEMARRVRLYRDDAADDMAAVIDLVFETALVKQERKKLIEVSKEQNITRLIVDQIASLYDRPARRELQTDGDRFRAEEKRVALHAIMKEAHRLTNLCNEVLVWQYKGVDGQPRLRLVTPDCFTAIPSPRDHLHLAGVLVDRAPLTILTAEARAALPHYELWDDTFRYLLNKNGHLVDEFGQPGEPIPHGLQRIPAVLLHRREPTDVLMEHRHGRDIDSAHLGVALLEVMVMRLSKSQGERQPILQGNMANTLRGQPMNGEAPIILPVDTVASMLDTKTDPDHYLAVKRDKIAAVAASYGMSYEFLVNGDDGAGASGLAYKVRREKLTELRLEQRQRALEHEAAIVTLMGFNPEGMRVDYQEQAVPQDAAEKLQLLKDKLHLGLDSPVDYLMREDPDLTREAAMNKLRANLSDWSELVTRVRALNMPADADAANTGRSPQENGSLRDGTGQPGTAEDPTQNPATGTATAA